MKNLWNFVRVLWVWNVCHEISTLGAANCPQARFTAGVVAFRDSSSKFGEVNTFSPV